MTTTYGFQQDKPERLSGIEATWDPGTCALLDRLGISPGQHVLEAGPGGGSIAAWMAERVGPDGHVLAVDIDTTHCAALVSDVLEVRRHDILRDPLPEAAFDIVHERSVVSWLRGSDAVARLAAAVRPGGVLLLEDMDWGMGGPGDPQPDAMKAYEAILALIEQVGYDRHFGRTLLARVEEQGFEDTGCEGRAYVVHGGSPGTAFERFSLLAVRDKLVGSGALTDEEVDGAVRYLEDPTRHVRTPVLYAAWGRKPA
jgi:SAM-dependent methyltransferase